MIQIGNTRFFLFRLRWCSKNSFAIIFFGSVRLGEYPRAILGIEQYVEYFNLTPTSVRVFHFFGKRLAKKLA
jgi:hypothetical protein